MASEADAPQPIPQKTRHWSFPARVRLAVRFFRVDFPLATRRPRLSPRCAGTSGVGSWVLWGARNWYA